MKFIWTLIGSVILLFLYMWRNAFRNRVMYNEMEAFGQPEEVRFFFLSDSHARLIHPSIIRRAKGQVDFVIIGGDFADQRTSLARVEQNLQRLSELGPIYFIWGNNDRELGEQTLHQLFARYNVRILMNDAVALPYENKLWLSAIDDTSSKYNIVDALAPCPQDAQIIFVSHNPNIFNRVLPHRKPLLMIGGHLHGGQLRLGRFGMQPHGAFKEENGVQTLVSNGYGTTLVPLRLGAYPETHIVKITIRKQ